MANHRMVMNQIIDVEMAVNREERRTYLREGMVTNRDGWFGTWQSCRNMSVLI